MREQTQLLLVDMVQSDDECGALLEGRSVCEAAEEQPTGGSASPNAQRSVRLRAFRIAGLFALGGLAVLGAALGGLKGLGLLRGSALLDPVIFSEDGSVYSAKDREAVVGGCTKNRFRYQGKCTCPPPLVAKDDSSVCGPPNGPEKMTFYMYRAAAAEDFDPLENVNMGNLAGVMYFLHHKAGRENSITRILRFKATVKTTDELWTTRKGQFLGFSAFDKGGCPSCEPAFKAYGAVVGCQVMYAINYMYRPPVTTVPLCAVHPTAAGCNLGGTWWSLPGPCPYKITGDKDDECRRTVPSGACNDPTGARDCTYHVEYAGEVSLEDIQGIKDHHPWWQNTTGHGKGRWFWDSPADFDRCQWRMNTILQMFKEKYPDAPMEMPEPPCR